MQVLNFKTIHIITKSFREMISRVSFTTKLQINKYNDFQIVHVNCTNKILILLGMSPTYQKTALKGQL